MDTFQLTRKIIVHEEKADVVRSIFGHYLAGASLGKIVDILNKYDEIKDLLSSEHTDLDSNEVLFYKSIIDGYGEILKCHGEIGYSAFPTDQKAAYLHNSAVIEMLKTYPCGFDSTKVKHFIQNFALDNLA